MPIIYAFLSCYYLNVNTIQGLVDRLNNDPALRHVCGFSGKIPSRSTFSRVFGVLALHRELMHQMFEDITQQLVKLNPDIGSSWPWTLRPSLPGPTTTMNGAGTLMQGEPSTTPPALQVETARSGCTATRPMCWPV